MVVLRLNGSTKTILAKRMASLEQAHAVGRPSLVDPNHIPPGMQNVRARVYMRLATCDEVDCPWFLNGWIDNAGVAHEPGQMCGRIHKLPIGMVTYHYDDGNGERVCTSDEFANRLGEGVHSMQRVLEDRSVI